MGFLEKFFGLDDAKSTRRELDSAESRLAVYRQEMGKQKLAYEQTIAAQAENLKTLEHHVDRLSRTLEDARAATVRMEAKLVEANAQRVAAGEREAELTAQVKQLAAVAEEHRIELEEANAEANRARQAARSSAVALDQEKRARQTDRDVAHAKAKQAADLTARLEADRNHYRAEAERSAERLKRVSDRAGEFEAELAAARARGEEQAKKIEELEVEVKMTAEAAERLGKEIDAVDSRMKDWAAARAIVAEVAGDVRDRLDGLLRVVTDDRRPDDAPPAG